MPWPFSRREPESADRDAGEGDGRRGGTRDPAAELRSQTRRRLIGAAALLLAAVIVLPMLLDTTPRPVREDVAITVASPPPVPKPADNAATAEEKVGEPAPIRSEPPATAEPPMPASSAPLPPPPAAAPPSSPGKPAVAAASAPDRFAVQVAALSSAAAAKELLARLKKSGFSAYVEAVSTGETTLHRVRIGPFASREEAQRAADKARAAGHQKATVVGG
jgi:DedD protein